MFEGFTRIDIATSGARVHLRHGGNGPFMAQPYDLPERMMAGVPAQWFMEKKLSKPGIGLGFFDPEAFAEYVRCFTWKTIRGSCEDYRACVTCDLEMDEADWRAGHKVGCPLLI